MLENSFSEDNDSFSDNLFLILKEKNEIEINSKINTDSDILTDKNKSDNTIIYLDQEPKDEKKEKKKKKFTLQSIIIVISLLFIFIFLTWVVPHDSWWDYQEQNIYIFQNYFIDQGTLNDFVNTLIETGNLPEGFNINQFLINNGYQEQLDQIISDSDNFSAIAPKDGFYGLYDIFLLIAGGFLQAFPIILYLFALGAFIEVVIQTKTFDAMIGSLLYKLKAKQIYIVPILFISFSAFGTIWGMQEESLAYYSIITPLMVLIGFEPIVAVMIMMVGNTTGMAASVINPFATGIASDAVGISSGTLFFFRLSYWFIITAIGTFFVTFFALKTRKDPKKIEEDMHNNEIKKIEQNLETDLQNYNKMNRKQFYSLIVFVVIIFIMILGFIPWVDLLGLDEQTYIDNWNNFFQNYFFVFSTIITPFGLWGFYETAGLFFFGIFLLILINRLKVKDWSKYVFDGMKGMISLVVVIAIARAVSIVIIYSGLIYTFINPDSIPGQNNLYLYYLIMFLLFFAFSMIIPSTSSLAVLWFPIIAQAFNITSGSSPDPNTIQILGGTVFMFVIAEGIANMITPTQAVVLTSLDSAGVSYKEYIKSIYPYVSILFVLTLILVIPVLTVI
ncbi:/ / Anaerobic C4-dicarboxylate membrane transporter protein / 341652:343490 Reverse [Candidatus Hepatoplasma crinochetorum]|uniref:/ / Anaerobic C4-dicarboxylate membrane transporter protein / 341652:343490 Reverse n=1 Tax=Candidatus Hepatoplasma crinochetorum TaxID=295596 RepID=A0A0G7ZMP9_9MOLU|nr:/ / Anaerobic C4-dicarboxylate membrane transporter protein / 341652:343490 Reverse [Candidatus Hepatoplasma crinochetorum]